MLASQNNREDQDAIQESVVLEVDVVDDEKTRREENGETGHMRGLLVRQGDRLDKSKTIRRQLRSIFIRDESYRLNA